MFFLILLSISPGALLCYGISYLLFIKALFLGDAFAHTYPAYVVENAADPVPADGRNAAFDRLNTFSNLLSMHHPWLNLWNLNFGYHNAHHDKVATPWYRLPAVQKELYGEGDRQYLPYGELWNTFHRNRLNCIMSDDIGQITEGKGRADQCMRGDDSPQRRRQSQKLHRHHQQRNGNDDLRQNQGQHDQAQRRRLAWKRMLGTHARGGKAQQRGKNRRQTGDKKRVL